MPPGLPAEKCPDAKTCRRYQFGVSPTPRWAVVDGRASIRYFVNPTGCGLSGDVMRQAMEDAATPWERAAPTLDFTFTGFTDRLPVPGDGHNVIGCTNASTGHALVSGDGRGGVAEADMIFAAHGLWTYSPCEQADNSCTPLSGNGTISIGSIATHEYGHWLWLNDMTDEALDRELTMHPSNPSPGRSRHWSTLALGDVLGVRALYPCSCPLPPIYSP